MKSVECNGSDAVGLSLGLSWGYGKGFYRVASTGVLFPESA